MKLPTYPKIGYHMWMAPYFKSHLHLTFEFQESRNKVQQCFIFKMRVMIVYKQNTYRRHKVDIMTSAKKENASYFSNPLRYYKEYYTYFVSFCNLSIRSAISSASSSQPFFFWEMSQFWQKTHLRLHIPKNIVPDPFQPWRTDSSPKWGKAEDTMAFLPILEESIK